jgi:hypothetical protein
MLAACAGVSFPNGRLRRQRGGPDVAESVTGAIAIVATWSSARPRWPTSPPGNAQAADLATPPVSDWCRCLHADASRSNQTGPKVEGADAFGPDETSDSPRLAVSRCRAECGRSRCGFMPTRTESQTSRCVYMGPQQSTRYPDQPGDGFDATRSIEVSAGG